MKRSFALLLAFVTLSFAAPVWALTPEEAQEARYQEMKAIKDRQRAEKEARKKEMAENPGAPREKSFWQKEGERSGLGNSGQGIGKFVRNLNPAPFFKDQREKYEARKAQAKK